MNRWTVCLAVLSAVAVLAQDGDVLELSTDDFMDEIRDQDLVLVEFYAPWCGHCKRLAPEYEIAATALIANDPPIPLAKVDCPANTALCGEFGVTGYPTLKIFRNGEFSADYQGPRSADGIISYMKKQAGSSAKKLGDLEAVKVFMDNTDYSILGFFSDESSALRSSFLTAADGLRDDFRFGITSDADVIEEYGYSDNVVIFTPPSMRTKMEDYKVVYDGEGSLKKFITQKFMGLAGIRTPDNIQYYTEQPLAVAYFDVDYVHNPKGSNYWRNRVIKVAKHFVGEVHFAVSNKEAFGTELQALGLDTAGTDVVVGIYDPKGKYAMTEKFSVDSFEAFVQQYLDGKLELYVKSEPVPEDNDGPVKVIVGKNFDSIVNDETKDVLLEFYAPWCGHCKSLAPKYEELGEKLSGNPNIVIAKSDATANDFPPSYEVRGYPTIYWVPAGSKGNPQKYEGGREVPDFISFIKKNATNKPVVVSGEEEKKKKKSEEL